MTVTLRNLLGIALVVVAPIVAFAQDVEEATEEALEKLDQMSVEVNNFVGDVRFDEGDVRNLIDLWDKYSEIGEDEFDPDDEGIDFAELLQNDTYLGWAASHGLNAEDWARKTVRITMMIYREQMLEVAKVMPQQMAEQMAMIEDQRAQLGVEMYQQIKKGMEESAKYSEAIAANARSLPKPTAAEQAILAKYRGELMMLMESDDEDDEYYDDEEFYDDDYEDDYE